jgi:hypothetical protein
MFILIFSTKLESLLDFHSRHRLISDATNDNYAWEVGFERSTQTLYWGLLTEDQFFTPDIPNTTLLETNLKSDLDD